MTLNAEALFSISGSTLTITLRNTGDDATKDIPGNVLSGVFFDLPDGIQLAPLSATVERNSILNAAYCDPGPCNTTNVGGEFAYNQADWSPYHSGDHGISSNGYIGVSSGNFNGNNIDDPESPNGSNFGIVAPTDDFAFKPNSKLIKEPLIDGEVVFTLAILDAGGNSYDDLLLSQISNVSFQYGTGFDQPRLPPGIIPPPGVPEPGSLLLLAPAVAWALRKRARSKAAR